MEGTEKKCTPVCEFFKCSQRKLVNNKSSNNPSGELCGWVGDLCKGSECTYSDCVKGRIRQDGSCGLLEKTVPKVVPAMSNVLKREDEVNTDVATFVKPKVLRKLKWYENE